MAFCYDDINIYGSKYDQTSPTGAIGGVAAYYKKAQFVNEKTLASSIKITYSGTRTGYLAYRIIGRTPTGMTVTEDITINAATVYTTRTNFRYLDKIEKLCLVSGTVYRVLSDGIFLDTNNDGHINSKTTCTSERVIDANVMFIETGTDVILSQFLSASNHVTPTDAQTPSNTLASTEEILSVQRAFYAISGSGVTSYYQKFFISNLSQTAINNTIVNLVAQLIPINNLSLFIGSDPANNDDTYMDAFDGPAPVGMAWDPC